MMRNLIVLFSTMCLVLENSKTRIFISVVLLDICSPDMLKFVGFFEVLIATTSLLQGWDFSVVLRVIFFIVAFFEVSLPVLLH